MFVCFGQENHIKAHVCLHFLHLVLTFTPYYIIMVKGPLALLLDQGHHYLSWLVNPKNRGSLYVGEAKRPLDTRPKEHRRAAEQGELKKSRSRLGEEACN